MEFINGDLLNDDKINKYRYEFNLGKPCRHVFIKDFLNEVDVGELLMELKKEKFIEKESDLFSFSQTRDVFNVKKGKLREFYDFMKSEEFLGWLRKIIVIKLNGKIDMTGTLYKSCDYLLCHDDRLEGRRIAFIYYLSDFEEEDGGSFVFYDSENGVPTKIARKFLPKKNSILLFEVSEKSFHEVEEVIGKKKRYAIGGWLQ